MKHIYFTITNDITYDQRMHRICTTLSENNYAVTLVGRTWPSSIPLDKKKFKQKRIYCFFTKGKLFYIEYNLKLFFFFLFQKMDAVCAIDLDTIVPCLYISRLKKIPRIYDAHELFTGLKEVTSRPVVLKFWNRTERKVVPEYKLGYTVSEGIAEEFKRRYGVNYQTIRNVPVLRPLQNRKITQKNLIYQGAVNEARGFEQLIPAMQWVDSRLIICGDGNFMPQLKKLIAKYNVENKVELTGMLSPGELWHYSQKAYIAIAVPENEGLNQYLALPNKFFDYISAGLPQVTVNYPEYQKLNNQFDVAILLEDLTPERIAGAINNLLADDVLYNRLKQNCQKARLELNWEQEEKKLLTFYQTVFTT